MSDPVPNATNVRPTRYELLNRYTFDGKLEMITGLHIGGGKATLSHTDSPVVLTPDGLPFIPGSSLKGVLRSTIEKFVISLPKDLGLYSCGLPAEEDKNERCPTARQKQIAMDRRHAQNHAQNVERFMQGERDKLCHTCQLFGSPFAAGRITINDLYLTDEEWSGTTQIRDGVAIDRDRETAKRGAKYDFEVVPSTTVFGMHLLIENATPEDLQMISIGLSEFVSGFGGVGGLRSRGLGACILQDLEIRCLDLTGNEQERKQRLLRYLLRNKNSAADGLDLVDTQTFFDQHIKKLFKEETNA